MNWGPCPNNPNFLLGSLLLSLELFWFEVFVLCFEMVFGSQYAAKAGIELTILLPLCSPNWDYWITELCHHTQLLYLNRKGSVGICRSCVTSSLAYKHY